MAAPRADRATSTPIRSKRRRFAGRVTREMTRRTPSCRASSDVRRLRSSQSTTETTTSLRPTSSACSSSTSVPSPFRIRARRSRAAIASPRAGLRSMTQTSTSGRASSRCASSRPTSPPPMIVTRWRSGALAWWNSVRTSATAEASPITKTLSPASSLVAPSGMRTRSWRRTATISTPRGRCTPDRGAVSRRDPASRRYSSSATRPCANVSASRAPGTATMRSMFSASSPSGQTTRSTPTCSRSRSRPPNGCSRSSREVRQIVFGEPSRLAMSAARTLTSSMPVAATRKSQAGTPACRRTSGLVPLPMMTWTSRAAKRSAIAAT